MSGIEKYQFLQRLKDLPFVDAIYLHGSRARGDADEKSDIDLAINCPTASDADWNTVLEIVEEADTLLIIDCARYDKVNDPEFKKNIDDNHIVLYQKGESE